MPNRISGRFHTTKGAVRQAIGRTVGWTALEMRGKTERTSGHAELEAARAQGYAKATGTRMAGKKDQIVGAVTGNRSQQLSGNLRRDKGDVMQGVHRNL